MVLALPDGSAGTAEDQDAPVVDVPEGQDAHEARAERRRS